MAWWFDSERRVDGCGGWGWVAAYHVRLFNSSWIASFGTGRSSM